MRHAQHVTILIFLATSLGVLGCEGDGSSAPVDVGESDLNMIQPGDVSRGSDLQSTSDAAEDDALSVPDTSALRDTSDVEDVRIDTGPQEELTVGPQWLNLRIPAQTGNFEIRFEMIADADSVNGVVGLAPDYAGAYSDLKANIRFASDGAIEARSDDVYVGLSPAINYTTNDVIPVVMTVDSNLGLYDVSINGAIVSDVAFRGGANPLNFVSLFAQEGSFRIRNLTVDSALVDLNPEIAPFDIVIDADMNDIPDRSFGSLTRTDLEIEFGPIAFSSLDEDGAIVGSQGGGKELRLRYRPASNGSARSQFRVDFAAHEELWMSYKILFEPGFEVVKGGKLPGLAGGTDNTGGNKPNGTDGFSARMMWRPANKLVVYLYHPDQPTIYGEDIEYPNFQPQTDVWYTIRERIVMNTNNGQNGVVQTWVDGVPMVDLSNIRFRSNDQAFGIDSFYFSTFYGGNDPTWAPSKETYIRFDDFKVATSVGGVD